MKNTMIKQKLSLNILVLCITMIIMTLLLCISIPIELEGKVKCDTGFIGLSFEQNSTGDIENLSLKNIDGMNCEIEYKGKIPFGKLIGGLI